MNARALKPDLQETIAMLLMLGSSFTRWEANIAFSDAGRGIPDIGTLRQAGFIRTETIWEGQRFVVTQKGKDHLCKPLEASTCSEEQNK